MTVDDYVEDILKMGHMRTWWIFGFEWWDGLKPAKMWTKDGHCFKPLIWGIWLRQEKEYHTLN